MIMKIKKKWKFNFQNFFKTIKKIKKYIFNINIIIIKINLETNSFE